MFGLLDWLKIGAGAALGASLAWMPAFYLGKHEGRQAERQATLTRSVEVLRERNATDDQIRNMDDAGLCRALGGRVSDDGACE